jgi:protein-glutamine gamma-glutamyltransferase
MARTTASHEPGAKGRWGDAAALILLAAGGAGAWWSTFGGKLLWLAPVIAVAALTTARVLRLRPAVLLAVVWVPASLLAAGLGAGVLAPAAWDTTATALRDGVNALPNIGTGTPVIQAWALGAVLLVSGTATGLAGMLWRGDGWERSVVGFALLLVPLGAAIAMQQAPDAPWEGAIVLVAVVLRMARGRLVPIVATASMVGAIALFGAQVAAPRAGWQPFGHHERLAQFHELDPTQNYGPLDDRRTGAVMLDITSKQPELWQMQVLEAFDNRRWLAAREDSHLPEPAARKRTVKVEVRGLRNRLIVSPGRIVRVANAGPLAVERGEGRATLDEPSEGDTYWVKADTVDVGEKRLAKIPVPSGRRYQELTQIGLGPPPRYVPYPLAELADDMPEPLRGTDWGRLFRLSYRLSHGVKTELAVVRRVENYLLREGRYHYTTDVGTPGIEPLMEFLFHTHQGYCQHFAGAAALILRVAGIPTRVVVGFATGEQVDKDTWAVRDEDAHAWIEVYFPSVGWVPFNPTPSAAQADVSPGLDVLQPASASAAGASGGVAALIGAAAILLAVALLATGLARRRRGPRTQLAELLVRLTPERSGPRTTLRSLHPTLTEIGPATADLALVAEHARFAPAATREPAHPGFTVWRALVADVGLWRSLTLLLRAATTPGRP